MFSSGRSRLLALVSLHAVASVPPAVGQARFEFTELHMGVPVRIALYAEDAPRARSAARAAFDRIAQLEQMMSDYRPTSEVSQLAWQRGDEGAGLVVSDELFEVLEAAMALAAETDGAFDPTAGALTALWRRSRDVGALPTVAELDEARVRVGWRHVVLEEEAHRVILTRPNMRLDLGGIAKGYVLDQTLEMLLENGVTRVLIEAGGDIVAGAAPPGEPGWHIAVPNAEPGFRHRAVALVHAALSTSGGSEQFVEIDGLRYSHIVDPRTGLGVIDHPTVFVIAPTGLEADGLATALAILGPAGAAALLAKHPDAEASFARDQ